MNVKFVVLNLYVCKDTSKLKDINKLPPWLQPVIKTIIERLRSTDELLKRNDVIDPDLASAFEGIEDLINSGQ